MTEKTRMILWESTPPKIPVELSKVRSLGLETSQTAAAQGNIANTVVIVAHPSELSGSASGNCEGFYVPGAHCRQGDILEAIRQTGKPVWIERGAFLSPRDMAHIVSRFEKAGHLTIVEAGSHMGYDDRVLDLRSLCLYESWKVSIALSWTDLIFGGGHASAFRPSWEDDKPLQESYSSLIAGLCSNRGLGLIVKKPPNPGDSSSFENLKDRLVSELASPAPGGSH